MASSHANCGTTTASARFVGVVALLACSILAPSFASAEGAADPPPVALQAGVVVERDIHAGEIHRYQLPLNAAEAVKIAVDQIGADIALQGGIDGPATADDEDKHRYGRELLLVSAENAGTVAIAVRAKSTVEPAGRYRLIATVFSATPSVAEAVTTFNAAARVASNPKRDKASVQPVAAALQQAIGTFRQLGDRELVAASLARLGAFYGHDLEQPGDGVAPLTEAVAIYEDLRRPTELVQALGALAFNQIISGQADLSLATMERSYEHAADVDPLVRANIEDDIVRATMDTGDLDRAATFGERAVATFRGAGAHYDEFIALERLALVYSRQRRFDDALRAIADAVDLGRRYGHENDVAGLTVTAGRIQMAAGDDDAALAAYQDALTLFKGTPSNRLLALLAIGRIYDREGDAARAKPVLERALSEMPPQLRDLWAATATELGYSLTLAGEPSKALELQQKALAIVDASQSRIAQLTVLRDITRTYRALGDIGSADAAIERANGINGQLPGQPYTALILWERARNAMAAGDLVRAQTVLDQALQLIESERGRLQSQALRASFGGTLQDYYDDAIDVALRMHAAAPHEGHDVRAFELFERSRARGLTELLSESRADVRAGVDPALLDEQRALQRQLGDKDALLRDIAGSPKNRARAAALEREIADIERRLAVLDGRIRASNPRYAALMHPAPATLRETQQLLDDGTVLLAISVGTTSREWAITRSSIQLFTLPPGSRIEAQARRVYDDLKKRQHPEDARAGGAARIDDDLVRAAGALSDLVLGPVADRLNREWRTSRLAIVATGALEYVPFAALPAPRGASAGAAARGWLVDRHELVQLPSVSVLTLLRDERERPAASEVALLADPVYSADDPRVQVASIRTARQERPTSGTPADSLLRGMDDGSTRGGLARLVFSREEAKAIAALAPRRRVFEALGFEASVRTIASAPVETARIVHIASHGIFNSTRPELSGLVLSLVDRRGRPEQGVLHLYDVFNLKLSADLVVLSGCETALGRRIRGEGLVGLSRAFMYAGARRVVASHWQVDDLATAELMRRFYTGLLVGKLKPAAALAVAERQMRASPRWRSPYYWAAFTLVGDWR